KAFETAEAVDFTGYQADHYQSQHQGHGRVEVRHHTVLASEGLVETSWPGFKTLAVVEAERSEGGKTTSAFRDYLSSRELNAQPFAEAVRGHWHIENHLHGSLDVAFREDDCPVSQGHGAANLGVLRHIALNVLKQDKSLKVGLKNERLNAGWDEGYLAKLLSLL
ncbi:MAG: ISAs1 family transposase, partial [Candidatus Competibacterales bacterium]